MTEKRFLTEKEVVAITRLALSTLRSERHARRGLPYYKIGRAIRYSMDDIIQYMDAHRIETQQT